MKIVKTIKKQLRCLLIEWMTLSISLSCVCCCCTVKYKSVIVLVKWFISCSLLASLAASFLLCLKIYKIPIINKNNNWTEENIVHRDHDIRNNYLRKYCTCYTRTLANQHLSQRSLFHLRDWHPAQLPFLGLELGCLLVSLDLESTFWP